MKIPARIAPTVPGTLVILISCVIGYMLSFQNGTPSEMLRRISVVLILGIFGSYLLDWRKGLRNLIRVDVFALLAFYFLTFFEFLFTQTQFDIVVIPTDVVTAVHLLLAGLAAMVIGRHLDVFPKGILDRIGAVQMQKGDFLLIFFGATFLNFLPMLLAVDFNPVAWFEETLKSRFNRAWARGQLGNLSSLLHELQLLGYVMPPVAGLIFARWRAYKKSALVFVGFFLLLLWYTAFSGGTRNIFAIQIAGFFAGYFIIQPKLRLKVIIPAVLTVGVLFVVLSDHMLSFRSMGLGDYVKYGYYKAEYKEFEEDYLGDAYQAEPESGYFVDYNVHRLSQLVAAVPYVHDHIGWNMPWVALTKPIPRAFWPGKPLGLKVGLEEAVGAEGYTVAVTWVGEAYLAGGLLWIVPIGLIIGAFCAFWNYLANFLHCPFALIVFASGFYATLLLMRSLMFFTTALLPSIALVVLGMILYHNRRTP
jgi:hypothetical protein